MKLTELAIDGYQNLHNFQLGRFSEGLNFVYGENGAGKSALRKFVRAVLFGHASSIATPHSLAGSPTGFVGLANGLREFRVDRDLAGTRRCHPITAGSEFPEPIPSGLTPDLFDSVFCFSLREARENANSLALVLNSRLHVARGASAAGDEYSFQNWKRKADARAAQLHAIESRIEQLKQDKADLLGRTESERAQLRSQEADLDSQLQSLTIRLNSANAQAQSNRLTAIETEISQLRSYIDSATKHVAYVPQPMPRSEPFAALYQRLDEIDNQIRRWRHVQQDVQAQRVKLKDDMAVWSELKLESDDHPYHNAREILMALESKVNQAEQSAVDWGRADGYRNDPSRLIGTIKNLCQSMKDDLYGLCQELAQQYKHIRHKAAAAELKQLRRCYHEMGENTDRLIRRRDAVIAELRNVDPAGADAIVRSEIGFCQCAMHEGYLEARKRLVSPAPAANPSTYAHQVIQPDLTVQRQQLQRLESERRDIQAWLNQHENESAKIRSQHADLIRQRDAIRSRLEQPEYCLDLEPLESELNALNRDYQLLYPRVEEDRQFVYPTPNALLLRAAKLLSQCTGGHLVQVFLSQNGEPSEFQIRDQVGKVLNFTALDHGQQDTVYLCLALAACESLKTQGISAPILIDDAFAHFSRDRVNPVIELYRQVAATGQQVFVLTQHQYLADRLPGVPVFELPPSTGIPNAFPTPERGANPATLPTRNLVGSDLPLPSDYATTYSPTVPVYDCNDRVDYIVPYTSPVAYPDAHPAPSYSTPVSTVGVDSIGDKLGYSVGIDNDTRLERIQIFDGPTIRALDASDINYVEQLLQLDPVDLPDSLLELGVSADQIDRWQAQVWLLVNVPGLRINDARILVACGVTEPEHLATSDARQLHERISRFLGSPEGFRFVNSDGRNHQTNMINLERIEGWYRALDRTRSQWQANDGFFSRRSRRRSRAASRPSTSRPVAVQFAQQDNLDRSRSSYNGSRSNYVRRDRSSRSSRESSDTNQVARNRERREPFVTRAPRMNPLEHRTSPPALDPVAHKKTTVDTKTERSSSNADVNEEKFRFYLDLKDHIEAAPSIGPKTAERFEKIGVFTVSDFLKQTAESMAAKIKYKRISADVVRTWQHQCRLVCRIPNLRGHDAQLLVACGYTEAEDIATLQPAKLFAEIGPFSDTKEGLKIIRNGKKPDLEEVTNWITWAGHTRSLQAA